MREHLYAWACERGVRVRPDWTVEQIADVMVLDDVPWPDGMTVQEGWQLWTARLRLRYSVKTLAWTESDDGGVRVHLTLVDKRAFVVQLPRRLLVEQPLSAAASFIEGHLDTWKRESDERLEKLFASADETFAEAAPDLIAYLLGFRSWTVFGGRLKPMGLGGDVWRGGEEVRASCGAGLAHRSPAPDCECGLYAWHSWAEEVEKAEAHRGLLRVHGAVVARGRMEIHSEGFRAEYMRPVVLGYAPWDDGGRQQEIEDLGRSLGVQVVPFDRVEEVALESGQLVPNTLKPPRERMRRLR